MSKLHDALMGMAGYLGMKGLPVPAYTEAEANAAIDEGVKWVSGKIERASKAKLRAKLAAEAMGLILKEAPNFSADQIAGRAVAIADAMVAKLGEKPADKDDSLG